MCKIFWFRALTYQRCGAYNKIYYMYRCLRKGYYRARNNTCYMYRCLWKGYIVRATRPITCTAVCGRIISCGQQDLLHVPLFEEGLYRAGNKTYYMYRCLWKGYIVRATRPITCTVVCGRVILCGQQELLHVPLFEERLYRAGNKTYYMYRYLLKGYIVRIKRSTSCNVV